MTMLFVLRKPLNQLNPALLIPSESEGEVVLLSETGSLASLKKDGTTTALSYDSLLVGIFEHDHTVVI